TTCYLIIEVLAVPFLFIFSVVCRFRKKNIDIGLGPEPLINNIYTKKALAKVGYSAETFVFLSYFITSDFDIDASNFRIRLHILRIIYLHLIAVCRYKIIYIYFNGGPLGMGTRLLKKVEPLLFKISNTKIVVMPYGGDVHDLRQATNLQYKNALSRDYPLFQKTRIGLIKNNIEKWTKHADHVISGCDWVEYMYYWDTLTSSYFSIDTDKVIPDATKKNNNNTVKILHCPNHANIKGSTHFEHAVQELQSEGYNVELALVQKLPNSEILKLMQTADIVADQLIIGWYAMTAIEAMCIEKPVLCFICPKLLELYESSQILSPGELPLVQCDYKNIKEKIKFLIENPEERLSIGKKGREFVIKHHSLEAMGSLFRTINSQLGISPELSHG
ncbi:MAG: glycosyltransferase, partial [Gammaproteobacteria bacterium]|nr:glycosyltransferase [Gammaproteobacteria bacterium]